MKTIRLIFFFALMLSVLGSTAQAVTLYIGGSVTQTPSMQPYPFHMVKVTIGQDSSNPAQAIIDSTLTSINGVYSMSVVVPWVPGTAVSFVVSTLDCQQYPHQQTFVYTGNSSQYGVNFTICGDSITPPECNNYFVVAGSSGLVVSLWGHMVNQQEASYSWDFGDGTTGNGEYVTHAFALQGTYSVALTTLTNDSCMDMTMQTVTVYDTIPPLACDNYINIISTSGLTVTMNGGMVNQQSATYSWSFGDGSAGSGVFASHTYPGQGTYLITLTTFTADSCMDITSQPITVTDSINPLPCDNYITIAGTQGLTASFTGGMVNQQSASYSWNFGDGSTGAGVFVSHTYPGQGTYLITLTTLTADSCMDVTSQPITVSDSINPLPCDNYISIVGSQGLTVSLNGGMVNQQSATYSWSFGDGAAGTGSIVAHTYPASGTYTISLTTTTADSCMDVSTITITLIDSITHNCNSYFTHLLGNIPNEIHFAGFTVSPYPTSFLFNFGDPVSGANNTSTLQNPIHTYLFPGTYIVTLTTYDSAGCTSVSYAQIVIELMNCDNFISVTGVQGLTVSLEGGLINGITASCLWNLGDGSSASGNFVTHTYAAQGTYNITLTTTTTEGCTSVSNTTVTVVDSVPISCNSYFTANAGNTLNQIHFEAHTNSPYPTTFLWNFGDPLSANNTSTLQDPDHIFSAFGTYLVTLTTLDSMNCTSQFVAPVSLSAFGFSSLYGQIFANNQPITACKVQLFDQNPDGTMNMIQEVMPDSVNYYNFNNVASGIYRILAIPLPGTVYAQQFVPTYFGDAFLWENAIPVALGQAANPYNIHLVAFDSISGGDGLINGELTTGGKSMSVGSQEILILDHTNTPVKYLFSLADGSFSFAGLPYGEYSVYPVITGITTYPVTVVLSETNKSATVVMKISGQTVAGIFDNKEIDFIENIFPNPADEQISAFVTVQGLIKCSVIDASGKMVLVQKESVPVGGGLITLPVSGLKPGLYILIVYDGNGNASGRRFVKK